MLALLLAGLPAPTPLFAAATDSTAASSELDTIIVTAQKRAESVQSVPASISVVSGDKLDAERITQAVDLGRVVPNLQTTAGAGEGEPNFTIRGVALNNALSADQGPVAVYYDEVYKGSRPLAGINLFDLERVEVLRGPQGTLYGKNASGGAVNFVSKTPGFDTEGYLSVGGGNYNRTEANGAFQTSITDQIALRAAFTYANADGWQKNLDSNQPNPSGTNYYAARISLLYNATDRLTFILRASTSKMNGTNFGFYATAAPPGPGTCFGVSAGIGCGFNAPPYYRTGLKPFEIQSDYVPNYYHTSNAVALTTTWKATDTLTLVSISSWDYGFIKAPEDSDGSPLFILNVPKTNTEMRQYTQDVRLTSDFKGPYDFIVGLYYSYEKSFNDTAYTSPGVGPTCDPATFAGCIGESAANLFRKTGAVYTDQTYKVTDTVTLRAGARVTRDDNQTDQFVAGYYNLSDGAPIALNINHGSNRIAIDKVTGKVGADFQLMPDMMTYASIATGFRGSAFNLAAYDSPMQLVPSPAETIVSEEIGVKSQWLNHLLTVNGAIFNSDYKNQQSVGFQNNLIYLVGIPKSRLYGAELELSARPVQPLRLSAALGYTHSQVVDGEFEGSDLRGNRLPLVAPVNGLFSANWDLLTGALGTISVGADAAYSSKMYFDLLNSEFLAQGGYTVFGSNLQYKSQDGKYSVTLWGRNLGDKFYFTQHYNTAAAFGSYIGNIGAPRTYGGTFEVKF